MTETKPKRRFRFGLRTLLVVVTLAAVGSWGYWVVWPWWQEHRQIAEFKIVAQYEAGYSDWKSWQYTITGDGKVTKDVKFGLKDTKEESKLSNDDLRDLIAKVKEADFFALKERYEPKYWVSDSSTLILTVTLDQKTHTVVVYAANLLENDKEVKQFFKAWSEVLRKVPSPNPNQKPDLYKP